MKRIDEHLRAADRQAGDYGAFTEPAHERSFRLAAQAGLGEPRIQGVNVVLGRMGPYFCRSWARWPSRQFRPITLTSAIRNLTGRIADIAKTLSLTHLRHFQRYALRTIMQ